MIIVGGGGGGGGATSFFSSAGYSRTLGTYSPFGANYIIKDVLKASESGYVVSVISISALISKLEVISSYKFIL